MTQRRTPLIGLGIISGCTLALEVLDTRLLSVITWYHLAFFVVSVAMLGVAAGALHVHLRAGSFRDPEESAGRLALAAALAMAGVHVLVLQIPLTFGRDIGSMASLALVAFLLAIPYVISGTVVALILTRLQGSRGRIYAADLLGAGLGCLASPLLLCLTDLPGAILLLAGATALSGLFFSRSRVSLILAFFLMALGLGNPDLPIRLQIRWIKGDPAPQGVLAETWTISSHVQVRPPVPGIPSWCAGGQADSEGLGTGRHWPVRIDGAAATPIVGWDGNTASLDWTRDDVTATLRPQTPGKHSDHRGGRWAGSAGRPARWQPFHHRVGGQQYPAGATLRSLERGQRALRSRRGEPGPRRGPRMVGQRET